jgi:hypothetical protein
MLPFIAFVTHPEAVPSVIISASLIFTALFRDPTKLRRAMPRIRISPA